MLPHTTARLQTRANSTPTNGNEKHISYYCRCWERSTLDADTKTRFVPNRQSSQFSKVCLSTLGGMIRSLGDFNSVESNAAHEDT